MPKPAAYLVSRYFVIHAHAHTHPLTLLGAGCHATGARAGCRRTPRTSLLGRSVQVDPRTAFGAACSVDRPTLPPRGARSSQRAACGEAWRSPAAWVVITEGDWLPWSPPQCGSCGPEQPAPQDGIPRPRRRTRPPHAASARTRFAQAIHPSLTTLLQHPRHDRVPDWPAAANTARRTERDQPRAVRRRVPLGGVGISVGRAKRRPTGARSGPGSRPRTPNRDAPEVGI